MRFLVPVDHGPMVRAVARQMDVRDWTDLGSGDGRALLRMTAGLPLSRRRCVVFGGAARVLEAAGWDVDDCDIREWTARSPGGDCVSLFDVIEHFEHRDADMILDRLESAYRLVVIFTPRGFMRQDATTHPDSATDPLMWHRSGFTEHDFDDRGYVTAYWPIYHLNGDGSHSGAILAVRGKGLRPAPVRQAWARCYELALRPLDRARTVARLLRHRMTRRLAHGRATT
jgi:hypothetical protein